MERCDYRDMLESAGVEYTPNRLAVMKIVGNSAHPVSAQEIIQILSGARTMNKVTVYRVLDLLVEKGLIERISSADRSFRYGAGRRASRKPHPHFFCTQCGHMECLDPAGLKLDWQALEESFPGAVDKVEIRVDGTCRNCLDREKDR